MATAGPFHSSNLREPPPPRSGPYAETSSLIRPRTFNEAGAKAGLGGGPEHGGGSQDDKPGGGSGASLGSRTIGYWGGIFLLVNNVTGPGMIQMPILFAQAGWVLPTVTLVLMLITSTFASSLMTKALTMVEGNNRLQQRLEMTTLARTLLPKWCFYLTMALLVICLQASNISGIIISAQTMDFALVAIYKSCALEFYPHFKFICVSEPGDAISAFGNDAYVITIGLLIVMVLSIPLGMYNLDDNIKVQIAAFWLMLMIVAEWVAVFFVLGPKSSHTVPAFGETQYVVNVLGTIVFNFAFVTSVPSYVNEKRREVSINKSLWYSTTFSTGLFWIIGFGGALAFTFKNNQTILQVMNTAELPPALHVLSQVFVYLFPVVSLISSIPILAIIIKYNLINSGMMGSTVANIFANGFPWLIAIPFYTGAGLQSIIGWTGIIVGGPINFIIPLVLYIAAYRAVSRGYPINVTSEPLFGLEALDPFDDSEWGISESFNPLPKCCSAGGRRWPYFFAIALMAVNALLIVAVFGLDLYYLIVRHVNLLG